MSVCVHTPRYRKLCQLLTEARLNRKLSQAALAAKIKRPQTFVSKYERGERRLDIVEFLDVSEILKIDPHDILKQVQSVKRR